MIDQLTDEQSEALMKIGSDSDFESMSKEVVEELFSLGLLHRRPSDGNLDLTDYGESDYEKLAST